MLLAILAFALVAAALTIPILIRTVEARRARRARLRRRRRAVQPLDLADPGRARRAEQRARELLRSCVNDEEWGMYRDLGFIRVEGRDRRRATAEVQPDAEPERRGGEARPPGRPAPYAYLIYPHRPIVAYVPATGRLLNEYCVEFPDLAGSGPYSRLPDSDDVLAKWMALTGDERRLIRSANMHLPGRQIDPARVRRDLWRLSQWERERSRRRDLSEAAGA